MERFRMELESLSQNEEFARVVVAVFMSRLNPTLEEVDDVKTAVSEAVTNAVIHGYKGGEGIILLEAEIDGQELTVRVRDRGMGIADVERRGNPCIPRIRQENAPEWDFLLWKHLWIMFLWSQRWEPERW